METSAGRALGVLGGLLLLGGFAAAVRRPPPHQPCPTDVLNLDLPTIYTIHSVPVPTLRRYIKFTPPPGASECLFSLDEIFGETQFLNRSTYVQFFFQNQDPSNTAVAVHSSPGNVSANPHIVADVYFQNCSAGADVLAEVASLVDVVALLLWSEVPIRVPEHRDGWNESLLCQSVQRVAIYLMVNTRSFDSNPFVYCQKAYPLMRQMSLINTSISQLPPNFPSLFPNLQQLELAQNNLEVPVKGFPWNAHFQDLPMNLTRTPNFNRLYTSNDLYQLPGNVFKRQLVLDGNRIRNLTDFEFTGCLDVLSIQMNGLTVIGEETFASLACLRLLNLNGNNLTEIPPHAFRNLRTLRNLILSSNHLTTIENPLFDSLTELVSLDLANNDISEIPSSTFSSLLELEALKLQNNKITSLRRDIFRFLTKLKVVDFSGNPIHAFPYQLAFSMEGLTTLFMLSTPMSIFNFSEICKMDLAAINAVLQDGSTLSHVGKNIRTLDLTNSSVTSIAIESTNRRCQNAVKLVLCTFQFVFDSNPLHCDPSIFSLKRFLTMDVKSLSIPCSINEPSGMTCATPEELRGRPLLSVRPEETYSPIQDALCPGDCRCYRRSVVNSVIVDCRGQGRRQLPLALPSGSLELWFQDNNVTSLPLRPYLPRTLTLNLSGNALQEVGAAALGALGRVRRLSLAGNLLAALPPVITRLRPARLELQGNPFRCDCHALWLKAWIRSRPVGLEGADLIKCSAHDGEGQQLQLVEDEDFVCVEVDELRLGLQSGLSSGVALAALVLAVLCYLRRQELKVWVYVHTGWHPLDRDKAGPAGEESHLYDVCVLSEEELDAWSFQEVSRRLEREWGYRVFHLWRDVALGKALHESAARAAGRSRRLVVVLEAGRAQPAWLGAGLQQALSPGLQRSPHFLVLLLHGNPRPASPTLHPQLQRYIRGRRYVGARAPRMFDRLMYHMPQKPAFRKEENLMEDGGLEVVCKPGNTAAGMHLEQAGNAVKNVHVQPHDGGEIYLGLNGRTVQGGVNRGTDVHPIPAVVGHIEDDAGQDMDSGVFDITPSGDAHADRDDGAPNLAPVGGEVPRTNADVSDIEVGFVDKLNPRKQNGRNRGTADGGAHEREALRGTRALPVEGENAEDRPPLPTLQRIDMFAHPPQNVAEGGPDLPVFVWYESSDFRFLMDQVVGPLSRLGVRFLLEDKDFLPGVPKSQNLLQAVAASRCSLVVLSAASLPDEWLLFAYQVALERHLADRRHRVALLRRADCPLATLDEELKQALAATAVLEEGSPWFQSRMLSLLAPDPDRAMEV